MTTVANTSDHPDLPDAPRGASFLRQLRAFFQEMPYLLRYWWANQREWLWVLVPLGLLFARSLRWGYASWISDDYLQAYQLLIPFAVMWIVWIRRPHMNMLLDELEVLFPGDSPKKRGNPWLLAVGCVLMTLSAISLTIPLAFLALNVMIAGCIFYLYGPFVLRALWQPLAFLLMAVPLPNAILGMVGGRLQTGSALISGQILKLLISGTTQQSVLITLPHYALIVSSALSGISLLLPVIAVTVWFNIYRNIRMDLGTILVGAAIVITIPIALFHVILLGLIGDANTNLGDALRTGIGLHITTFLLILLGAYLVQLAARKLPRLFARRLSEFEQDLQEAQRASAAAMQDTARTEDASR